MNMCLGEWSPDRPHEAWRGREPQCEPVVRIAAIVVERAEDPDALATLLKRLDLGVPEAALALAALPVTLSRGQLLQLWRAGLTSAEDIAAATHEELEQLIGRTGSGLLEELREAADEYA
ncbi:MAG: hypothetical protein DI534_11250 [Leifsonia xyli]|nr:MAG: hypothetical protein DI534_11250 [Leifsonia xyli]